MQVELLNLAGGPVKGSTMWDGASRVVQAHGRYADAVVRGNVFQVSDTAGNLIPAGLSTAPTTVTLYNPLGSGVFLSLLYAAVNTTVLFAVTSVMWVGVTPPSVTAPTFTTYMPATNTSRGGVGGSRVMPLGSSGGAIALPTVPTILGELGLITHGAVNLLPYASSLSKWFDGVIGVGPGGTLSIQSALVGPTAGCFATWIWEEIPQYGSGPSLAA